MPPPFSAFFALHTIEIVTGGLVYIVSAFVLIRRDAGELVRLGREAISRRRK